MRCQFRIWLNSRLQIFRWTCGHRNYDLYRFPSAWDVPMYYGLSLGLIEIRWYLKPKKVLAANKRRIEWEMKVSGH